MHKILKPLIWLMTGAALICLIAFKLNSNQAKSDRAIQQELQSVPFVAEATQVSEKSFSDELSLLGSVEPSNVSVIYSEAEGRLLTSSIEKGKTVAKGETLATLDPTLRKAAHEINKVNYEKAKTDFERIEQLFKENNASKMDVDNARNQLLLLEQQATISEKQLQQTVIRAGMGGVVSEKRVTVGEYVQPGNVLGTIVELKTVLVKVFVPEHRIASIHVGQAVNITTDVFPAITFKGTIKNIVPVANEAKAFPVEVAIINDKKEKLLAGMTMKVLFGSTQAKTSLVVPRTALLGNTSGYFVFAVSHKNQPLKKAVLLGQDFGEFIEIMEGLSLSDTIITSGQANVEQGKVLAGLRLK
jgi:RND family efflux transporter MFP subunit